MNNQDFTWDDRLVIEFFFNADRQLSAEKAIYDFKASKQKPLEYEILVYGWQENQINMPDLQVIYKVKRLSDEAIFSLNEITVQGRIASFNLSKDTGLHVEIDTMDQLKYNYPYQLSEIKKAETKKQPILFKTTDNVEIFDGDKYYAVHDIFLNISENIASISVNYNPQEKRYLFSTKEAAEEYINLNRPCLSAAEVYAITAKYGLPTVVIEQEIAELVKFKNK